MDLFSTEKEKFHNEIKEFTERLHYNITKRAKYDIGCTFILLESRDSSGDKNFVKLAVFLPLLNAHLRNTNLPPYTRFSSSLYMLDRRLPVDENVYLKISAEMLRTKNIAVGQFLPNGSLTFGSVRTEKAFDLKGPTEIVFSEDLFSFDNMEAKPEFEIELTNPDGYYLPFPVKRLVFGVNLFHSNINNFLFQKNIKI